MTVQQEFFKTNVLPAAGEIEAWRPALVGLFDTLAHASASQWEDENFLRDLWASNAVSSVGQGDISVDPALADLSFRTWFGSQARVIRELSGQHQIDALKSFCDELYVRFKALGMKSMPRLKVHRVLAALAPASMTTVANAGSRKRCIVGSRGKKYKKYMKSTSILPYARDSMN